MKKRFLTLILSLTAMLMCIFSLTACGDKEISFKLNFVVDDTVYATIDTSGDEVIALPENPTKEKYSFVGWFWDKDVWKKPFTANSLLDAPLSSDMSVYAKFSLIHNCDFKEKVASDIYKATGATCENKATYYFSCSCGEMGTETFESGVAQGHSFTNYISDNNATYEVDGTKTAVCNRNGCNETDTITDNGSKLQSYFGFNLGYTVNNRKAYIKVCSTTKTIYFPDEIVLKGNSTYKVYKDIGCENELKGKELVLENVGENKCYILATVNGEDTLYHVTIYLRTKYTVNFITNNNTTIESQVIEEDSLAIEPTIIPTRDGYTFNGWDYDFTTPITESTTVNDNWTANTDTKYTVNYYLQNIENDNYTLAYSDKLEGTTDTTATAVIKYYENFTYNEGYSKNVLSGNINGNGSSVLSVYYARDTYTVTFNGNGGELTNGELTQKIKYGGSATAPTFRKSGYELNGFDKTLNNITANVTITAFWKIKQYTLTIVFDNGEEDLVITQDYNTEINTTIKTPQRGGYKFLGWNETIPTVMPPYNNTITAKWGQILKYLTTGEITGLTSYGRCLSHVVIPNEINGIKITRIGNYAFAAYDSLESIVIPDSVTSIGYHAISGTDSLKKIYYRGTYRQWLAIDIDSEWNYESGYYTTTFNYMGD